ncbi:extracellular serine-rich protein [Moniliophthora roreri MCA 2997]|uniref:Extracellular serine-rich protein n=1 Tax=Moniliophthora roreri (strain MCA 2997) TaxID=1381753 RepID=V2Z053_MONRO|nr:extracellular serine-rich protein [Moniliophthora roreri MCA 2997]
MRFQRSLLTIVAAFVFTQAQGQDDSQIWVQVGVNSTNTTTFTPNVIFAQPGKTVMFNFTQGNLTAIESSFAAPCVPVNIVNSSISGFNSGFRDISPGSSPSDRILAIPIINGTNWPRPQFFFDYNTCGVGGVGVINPNNSALETIDGLVRNAKRLNGSSHSSTSRSATSGSSPTATSTGSDSDGVAHYSPMSISATLFLLVGAGVTLA